MGICTSKQTYISSATGGERDYQERFLESKTLGQGEFGVVKMVHDVKNKDLIGSQPLAVKYLKKGFTFKDNTLYTPLKKEVLQGEVEILRSLNGEQYNLKLIAVYESPSMIYMVTEYCEGGEMMPWLSKAYKDTSGLRTEDVSRICYQLWSAVNHCSKHKVIHRDIKPENVMFRTSAKDAELRLIDFGSGTMDGLEKTQNDTNTDTTSSDDVDRHHTFAGSAFYISPEMFQRTYTDKTDVWSAGATLYVLVAGYPADRLQETFNVLQGTKPDRLRKLPNLPDNMPESFYTMLEGAMAYRHKSRKDAGQLLNCEFSQFHIHHKEGSKPEGNISIHDIAAEAADHTTEMNKDFSGSISMSNTTTKSVLLEGSVTRHNAYLGYQKFERSVTTLLATMLSKDTCKRLLTLLREQNKKKGDDEVEEEQNIDDSQVDTRKKNAEKLQVVTIKVLLEVLGSMKVEDSREVSDVIGMIKALKDFTTYESFAYHISLLRQFVSIHSRNNNTKDDGSSLPVVSSVHGNNVFASLRKKRGLGASTTKGENEPDDSGRSAKSMSMGGMRRVNTSTGRLSAMS